ncbi:capsid protein [Bat tymo-like virus]|uniref:capsid protein n=1 Tax=Bat tymo-like virus TaxID=1888311 RepID=UPI00083F1AE5|nr:capsid protein [Bat tymo-like virus]AOC55059.1 capsid protein [Bat tymo-like virus]
MASLLPELALAAAPIAIDAVSSLFSSPSDSSPAHVPSRIPIPRPARSSNIVSGDSMSSRDLDVSNVLSNPALPTRPRFFDVPSELGPSINLPFQFKLHDWIGDNKLVNLDISASEQLIKLLAPYRYAQLLSLEVLVLPRQSSSKWSGTCEVRFMPSDATPLALDMLEHPGAMSISVGGPLGFVSNSALSCDLSKFSPVVKSPFLPTDRVRVAVNHWLNTDATTANTQKHVIFTTLLRGTVKVAYPSFS